MTIYDVVLRRNGNNVNVQDGLVEQEGAGAAPVEEQLEPCSANLIERHVERPRTTEGLSATTNEGKRGEALMKAQLVGMHHG